jgi:hypothetical protein
MPIVVYTDSNQDATLYGLARKMAYAMESGAAPMQRAIENSSGRILFQKIGDVVRALVTVINPEIIVGAVYFRFPTTSLASVYRWRLYTWGKRDSDTGYISNYNGIFYGPHRFISRDGKKLIQTSYGVFGLFDRKTFEGSTFGTVTEVPDTYLKYPLGIPAGIPDETFADFFRLNPVYPLRFYPYGISGNGRAACGYVSLANGGDVFLNKFYRLAATSRLSDSDSDSEFQTTVLEIPENVRLPSGEVLWQRGFRLDPRIAAYYETYYSGNPLYGFTYALRNYSAGASEAFAVSEDGRTACGCFWAESQEWGSYLVHSILPCVWRDGVFELLDPGPPLSGLLQDSWMSDTTISYTTVKVVWARATHLSKDGQLIVGYRPVEEGAWGAFGSGGRRSVICFWGPEGLSTFVFPNNGSGRPQGMSDDGSVVVGNFEDFDGNPQNSNGEYLADAYGRYARRRHAWVLRRGADGSYALEILKGSDARPEGYLRLEGCSRSGRVIVGNDFQYAATNTNLSPLYGNTVGFAWRDGVLVDLPPEEMRALQPNEEGAVGMLISGIN